MEGSTRAGGVGRRIAVRCSSTNRQRQAAERAYQEILASDPVMRSRNISGTLESSDSTARPPILNARAHD
jgi:hypothetical protein